MQFSDKLVKDYGVQANLTLAAVCRGVCVLMILIGSLNLAGVFVINGGEMYSVIGLSIIISLLPTLFFNILHKNAVWAQYLVLSSLVLVSGTMYAVVSYHSIIMLVFPLACACLYSERKWVVYTIGISIPMIVISHLVAFQLKFVPDEPLVTMHGVIFYGILPRIIQYLAIGLICSSITDRMRKLIESLVEKNEALYENQQTLITSLSELIESQSQETGEHVKRVAEYTRILCEGLHMDSEETWRVSIASMMHDVGKLMVPVDIINKPGKLTEAEFEQVKRHVDYGKQMLEKSPGQVMQTSAVIAYEHHEKWDGTGYKKTQGEAINLYARCVAIADVFDALVSRRPYKRPWTPQEAYDEIVSQSGRHFDPQIVKVFQGHFDEFLEVLQKYPESCVETEPEVELKSEPKAE